MLPLTGSMESDKKDTKDTNKTAGHCWDCMQHEAWLIVATIVLQDGPFLAIRLYIILTVQEPVDDGIIFFVGKNILVISLQIYLLIVLACSVECATKKTKRRRRKRRKRKRKRPRTKLDHSSTGRTTSSNSIEANGAARLDSSSVVVIEEAEEEGSSRPTTSKHDGYSNAAYSMDSSEATA